MTASITRAVQIAIHPPGRGCSGLHSIAAHLMIASSGDATGTRRNSEYHDIIELQRVLAKKRTERRLRDIQDPSDDSHERHW